MNKFVLRGFGLVMVMSLALVRPVMADESEVSGLKSQVKDLSDTVNRLQKQVQTLESSTPSTPTHVVPAGAESGGLLRTVEDIKMSGYADVQYNNNLSNHRSGTGTTGGNALRSYDANQNTFSVNTFKLIFEKAPNPEGGAGFRLDLAAGEDIKALDGGTNGATTSQVGFQQAYIDVVAPLHFLDGNEIFDNTIDIKAGRMNTLAGVEVFDSKDNWLISRGLLFGFAVPTTHTGLRATYNLFQDKVTTYFGLNNGWDANIDNNTWKTWEAGVAFSPIDRVTYSSAIYFGPEAANQEGHKRFLWSHVLGWDVTDRLSIKGEFDYGKQRRFPVGGQFENANWYGFGAFARYALTNKWGVAYRLEVLRDNELSRTGSSHTLWEQTFGTDYKFYDNLTGRFEYRFDKSNDNMSAFNGEASQSTLGAQLIYSFA